jgi:hypothetical protein
MFLSKLAGMHPERSHRAAPQGITTAIKSLDPAGIPKLNANIPSLSELSELMSDLNQGSEFFWVLLLSSKDGLLGTWLMLMLQH